MARKNKYRSVNITRFFMKLVGLWYAETEREKSLLNVILAYTIVAISFATATETIDLYHCLGDIYATTYNLCATVLLAVIFLKFGTFIALQKTVKSLILHAENHFWCVDYDEACSEILRDYDRKGILMTYTYTFIVGLAGCNLTLAPLFENRGRSGTDRLLPFKMWVDFPVTATPWFEITYVLESLSTYHAAICTFCFDNFICTFNIHAAAQFKILSYKITSIVDKYVKCTTADEKSRWEKIDMAAAYAELASCVRQHRTLIWYMEQMERVFMYILLGQVLTSSLLICIAGFQFVATESTVRKCVFIIQLMGSLSQLLILTWSCNAIIVQSTTLAEAAYNTSWYLLPQEGRGKALKDGLRIIMIRASRPCALTAGGFTTMSLETFTSILSTSISYFTLLRQMSEEE